MRMEHRMVALAVVLHRAAPCRQPNIILEAVGHTFQSEKSLLHSGYKSCFRVRKDSQVANKTLSAGAHAKVAWRSSLPYL